MNDPYFEELAKRHPAPEQPGDEIESPDRQFPSDRRVELSPVNRCTELETKSFRTSNGWWFIAICQRCGLVKSSIVDGADSVKWLAAAHQMNRDRDTELPFILSKAQRKQTHQILTQYLEDRKRSPVGSHQRCRTDERELSDLIACFERVSS